MREIWWEYVHTQSLQETVDLTRKGLSSFLGHASFELNKIIKSTSVFISSFWTESQIRLCGSASHSVSVNCNLWSYSENSVWMETCNTCGHNLKEVLLMVKGDSWSWESDCCNEMIEKPKNTFFFCLSLMWFWSKTPYFYLLRRI